MDLTLKESQRLLAAEADRFFERSYPLERMREMFLLKNKFDPALWKQVGELGWNAAPFPESIGGLEGSLVDAMLLLVEMGKNACPTPYLHSTVAAGLALAKNGAPIAQEIAQSRAVVIPLPSALLREAVFTANRLTAKTWPVPWAEEATHFLIEVAGSACLVEAETPGLKRKRLATSNGEPLCELMFAGAPTTVIGPAPPIFADIRSFGAFACAAFLLGLSERALALCVDYAKERVQFGRPIGSFQAIQHKAADLRIIIEVGHALLLRAAAEDNPARFALAAAKAKSWMADGARKVSREAMQIFGGISFCGEHPVQLIYQLVITLANHYGAAHEHREAVADALLRQRHGL